MNPIPAHDVPPTLLLIDDDTDVLDAYRQLLQQAGYRVIALTDPRQAMEIVSEDWPGIVVSDVCMPGCSGLELMALLKAHDRHLPVLLITGHGDVPMAVDAVKKGAWDFMQKPVDADQLLAKIATALAQRQAFLHQRNGHKARPQAQLIGRSEWINQLRARLQPLAQTDVPVFFYGELGVGRTLAACYLHQCSRRRQEPISIYTLAVDEEAALDDWMRRVGNGTLVLKNIEHLSASQQRLLAQQQGSDLLPFRLIGISNVSLLELASSGAILPDLYYRFAMTQIPCPPLSQRLDDIEPLYRHALQQACLRLNHPLPPLSEEFIRRLTRRPWPGNIRELVNAAELYAVGVMPLAETPNPLLHQAEPTPLDLRVEQYERQIITEALNIHLGRINDVSEYLQIPRKKLYLRMKKYGLDKHHYR